MKHRIILILIAICLLAVFKFFGLLDSYWSYSLPYLIISLFLMTLLPVKFIKIWLIIMIPILLISLVISLNTSKTCSGWAICFDRIIVVKGLSKLFLILTVLIVISKFIYIWSVSRKERKTLTP